MQNLQRNANVVTRNAHDDSASLEELRGREAEVREAAARAAEAERVRRMPKNRARVGFREERAREKRVRIVGSNIFFDACVFLRIEGCVGLGKGGCAKGVACLFSMLVFSYLLIVYVLDNHYMKPVSWGYMYRLRARLVLKI